MTQILFIHGGESWKTQEEYINYLKNYKPNLEGYKSWGRDYIDEQFPNKVIHARMPCTENAKYEEWKIMFENYLKVVDQKIILLGNSLGGIFLAKYLSENEIDKDVAGVFLVAPPFDGTERHKELFADFALPEDMSKLESFNPVLMFSESDTIVPVSHAELYREKLPNSKITIYKHIKDHFFEEKFPELIEMIKEIQTD